MISLGSCLGEVGKKGFVKVCDEDWVMDLLTVFVLETMREVSFKWRPSTVDLTVDLTGFLLSTRFREDFWLKLETLLFEVPSSNSDDGLSSLFTKEICPVLDAEF